MRTSLHFPSLILLLALTLSIGAPVAARGGVATGKGLPVVTDQALGPTDRAELEAFLDELIAAQMEEKHIAGAAVAVVKDGQLFFAKGYGYADVENKIPVDAATTIFRIGSVGKVLTWTAVMQLVEQGKLDLDADIATYLDFRLPTTFPQPITLKHLMTHTSGIEDRWLDSLTADAGELVSERAWLEANFPGQVRAPGEAAGYSNYNPMLAGYIVARVSGQSYEAYIQQHIFDPLGMTHSTVNPQMPEELRPFAAKSYTYVDGAFQPFPEYFVQPAGLPSGFHQASVTDMARFMIARLEGGFYGDASTEIRILEEDSARQMLTTLYTPDPRLKGIAYGLFDFSENGQWVLGHEGYAPVMASQMMLLPDQHLGVFVTYNSLEARDGGLVTKHFGGFQRAFFDHYFPAPASEAIQPPADFAERAGRFTGFYREANSHSTTPEKVINLLGALEIRDPGDGTLLVPLMGRELRFAEVEPLFFRQVDGPFSMVFREDEQGHIAAMATDLMSEVGFRKLAWYETPAFNQMLALACVLLFLSMLPVALIRAIRNRRSGGDQPPAARIAAWVSVAVCALNLLFLAGIMLWFRPMRPSELHGLPLSIEIVLGLGVLAALLTLGALVCTVLAWKDRYWGVAFLAYYSLVTVAAVGFVWFLHYWNWLGWRY
ncbi:MAG TPA: serine hydrolase domain-containing protein [Anaerolineae bacterium]|nr:serine hydrolase domain-containing protein [Anaerolineae bacterium]HNU02775.1 serine hydrolase domain-containing protein [Anaerolineae bacterium]